MTTDQHRGVLVQLVFWCPVMSIDQVVQFLRQLDQGGVKWDAQMDSHPSDELLASLPPRVRILHAERQLGTRGG